MNSQPPLVLSQQAYESLLKEVEQLDPKCPASFRGDKAGVGRYILGFILGGIYGLWIVYWARYYGWRGVWICLALLVVMVAILVATGDK